VNARDVIRETREAGGHFTIVDGGLRLRNPKRVPPALIAEIAANRAGIIAQLSTVDRKPQQPAQLTLADYARQTLPTTAQIKAERAADPWITDQRVMRNQQARLDPGTPGPAITAGLDDPQCCPNGGHPAPQAVGEACPTCNTLYAALDRLPTAQRPHKPSAGNKFVGKLLSPGGGTDRPRRDLCGRGCGQYDYLDLEGTCQTCRAFIGEES
jgi:hypothetical protein